MDLLFIRSGRHLNWRHKRWLPPFTMMLRVIKTRHSGRKKKKKRRDSLCPRWDSWAHKTFPASSSALFFFFHTVAVKMIRTDLHFHIYLLFIMTLEFVKASLYCMTGLVIHRKDRFFFTALHQLSTNIIFFPCRMISYHFMIAIWQIICHGTYMLI